MPFRRPKPIFVLRKVGPKFLHRTQFLGFRHRFEGERSRHQGKPVTVPEWHKDRLSQEAAACAKARPGRLIPIAFPAGGGERALSACGA